MEENKNVPWSGYGETAPVKPAASLPFFPTGGKEAVFGAMILIFTIFLTDSFLFSGFNLGYALGMAGITAGAVVYLLRGGHRGSWYGWTLLGLSMVILMGFARADDGFVKFVMFCGLFVSINLGLCDLAGKTVWSTASVRSLLDCFRTAFGMGIGKIDYAFRGIKIALQTGSTVAKKGSAVLLGAVIAVPVLAVMIPLLMSADAAFEGLLDQLPEWDFEELLATAIVGFGIACVVYTRAVALMHHPKSDKSYVSIRKGLNLLTVNTALGAVCVLYAVYLVSQLAYFWGGLAGILPKGFTVAEYARRGFFEMAWLCVINLSVMILAITFTEKKEGKSPISTRFFCLFIGIITLFLVVTAGAKMVLYIGSFGMTRLRVLTMVIMVFFGLTTAVISVWLFVSKLPYMKIVVLSALILGAAVLWADVDSVVAKYNVDAYLSGTLQEVDMSHLYQLGSGAIPHLHRLAQEAPDVAVRNRAAEILTSREYRYQVDFQDWNYADSAADEIVKKYH
jgi:hypothetical protein